MMAIYLFTAEEPNSALQGNSVFLTKSRIRPHKEITVVEVRNDKTGRGNWFLAVRPSPPHAVTARRHPVAMPPYSLAQRMAAIATEYESCCAQELDDLHHRLQCAEADVRAYVKCWWQIQRCEDTEFYEI